MTLELILGLGLLALVLLDLALFFLVRWAVLREYLGPLVASLVYGLCLAVLPYFVWWGLGTHVLFGKDTTFLAPVVDVGLAFILYTCVWLSWGVSLIAGGLASWRFFVGARRIGLLA
ncbi:hypothetical protein D3C87_541350 [compost metagenome]